LRCFPDGKAALALSITAVAKFFRLTSISKDDRKGGRGKERGLLPDREH